MSKPETTQRARDASEHLGIIIDEKNVTLVQRHSFPHLA
jgi:hypothetical protein